MSVTKSERSGLIDTDMDPGPRWGDGFQRSPASRARDHSAESRGASG